MTKKYKNGIPNSYPSTRKGFVYFARAVIKGTPLIKIGFWNGTYNIANTLKYRYKSKFTLLHSLPGDGDLEQDLHIKFEKYRQIIIYERRVGCELVPVTCTEFFRAENDLIDFIETLRY